MKAYRIQVIGRVQGVFFRVSTKKEADSLGLVGWVRNETDGSVLIEVTGPEEKIEKFVRWCWQGSPASKVEDVKTEGVPPQEYKDFCITY